MSRVTNLSRRNLTGIPDGHIIYHGELETGLPSEKVFGYVDEGYLANVLRPIPKGAEVVYDVEGSLTERAKEFFPELVKWHWMADAEEAYSRRLDLLLKSRTVRPDLFYGFYEMSSPDYPVPTELLMAEVWSQADFNCITAYPQQSDAEWRRRFKRRLGAALYFTGRPPRVFVTHTGADYDQFARILDAVSDRGLEMFYWLGSKEPNPQWWVNMQLWLHR